MTIPKTAGRYDEVWRAASPYMRARKNDIHIPLSYAFAGKLMEAHPDADADIVLLAILLHDIGWHSIDMADILDEVFGPNRQRYDVRILHEKESVRLYIEAPRRADGTFSSCAGPRRNTVLRIRSPLTSKPQNEADFGFGTLAMTGLEARWPNVVLLPHPSHRNAGWFQRNAWFEIELLPVFRVRVAGLLGNPSS